MSTNNKYILIDGKYLLNADHVESVGSMHTVQELSDKSQAPSGVADLTEVSYTEQSYNASSDIGMYSVAGSISLNLGGSFLMADIGQNSSQNGVRSAIIERAISFSWVND